MKRKRLILCLFAFTLLNTTVKSQTYDTLSHFGANWKYLDDGSDQDATNWKLPSFSDASWSCGPSPIGYGDTWIVTCIQSGCVNDITCAPACGTKNITDWFRQVINVPSVSSYYSVAMDALFDDGAVVYVNGNQVWSYNMPSTFNYTTWSTATISGSAETTQVHQVIPMTYWVNGNNTIAVEMHQRGPTSSDVTLDMQFRFLHYSPTSVSNLINNDAGFNIFPNPSNGAFSIETKNSALRGQMVNLEINDLTGRKVAEQQLQLAPDRADLSLSLIPGIYFGHLSAGETNANFRLTIE